MDKINTVYGRRITFNEEISYIVMPSSTLGHSIIVKEDAYQNVEFVGLFDDSQTKSFIEDTTIRNIEDPHLKINS